MRIALLMLLTSTAALAGETNCSVVLTDAGEQKINVIKIVREYTSLGLKDCKDLVEAPKPRLIRDGMACTEADALVAALAAKGAVAEVQQAGRRISAHPKGPLVSTEVTFDVTLESWGTSKIMVIKIVRERTGLGLAETKKLVESAPAVVVKGLSRSVAETVVKDLTANGAKASLSPSR